MGRKYGAGPEDRAVAGGAPSHGSSDTLSKPEKRPSSRKKAPRTIKLSAPKKPTGAKDSAPTHRPVVPVTDLGTPPGLVSTITNGGATVIHAPKDDIGPIPSYDDPDDDDDDPSASQEEDMMDEEEEEEERQGNEVSEGSDDSSDGETLGSEDSDTEESGSESEDEVDPHNWDSHDLMKPPFNAISCGKSWAGKTEDCNAYLEKHADRFDQIFVVTQTPNGKIAKHATGPDFILPTMSEQWLRGLIEWQGDNKAMTLVVYEDFLGIPFKFRSSEAMKTIGSKGRHDNLSSWFLSQDWVEIPMIFRRNSNHYRLGKLHSNVADAIAEEISTDSIPKEKFRKTLCGVGTRVDDWHKEFFVINAQRGLDKVETTWDCPKHAARKRKRDAAESRRNGKRRKSTESGEERAIEPSAAQEPE